VEVSFYFLVLFWVFSGGGVGRFFGLSGDILVFVTSLGVKHCLLDV
jgi:hypothetical protein